MTDPQSRPKALRRALLAAQLEQSRRAGEAVALVISGHTATLAQPLLHQLDHWLENRATDIHALEDEPFDHRYPPMWRYWRRLPARGRIGVFVHGWYQAPLFGHVEQRIGDGQLADQLDEIRRFEASLEADGVRIVKCWLDIDAERERAALSALASDPATAWQCTPEHWVRVQQHAAIAATGERIRRHAAAQGPGHADNDWWIIRDDPPITAVARRLLAALTADAATDADRSTLGVLVERFGPPRPTWPDAAPRSRLGGRATPLARADYEAALGAAQGRLGRQLRRLRALDRALVVVFEGADAAGKGGTLHRMTGAMDPRHLRVHAIGPPNDDERAHPWLWRFWIRLPRRGRIAIFDRSWYGRVLVERVEGFAKPDAWRRAYAEIREFERQLVADGAIVAKFFLDIDADTQLERFEARRTSPHKRHKLTDEDWRNRARWDDYQAAFADMLDETDAPAAPWHVIPAQCKLRARIDALTRLADQIAATLGD